jgi:metal-responsive CopG/Arc/MetJ family transcriptional regulator
LSYTPGMKIAVSIPEAIFEQAEKLAKETEISRSALYARALSEYVARHDSDHVTEAMNRVCKSLSPKIDKFAAAASHRILEQSEW